MNGYEIRRRIGHFAPHLYRRGGNLRMMSGYDAPYGGGYRGGTTTAIPPQWYDGIPEYAANNPDVYAFEILRCCPPRWIRKAVESYPPFARWLWDRGYYQYIPENFDPPPPEIEGFGYRGGSKPGRDDVYVVPASWKDKLILNGCWQTLADIGY